MGIEGSTQDHLLQCESEIRQFQFVVSQLATMADRERDAVDYFRFRAEVKHLIPYAMLCQAHQDAESAYRSKLSEARMEIDDLKVVARCFRKQLAAEKAEARAAAEDDAVLGLQALRDELGPKETK